jgi:hypothetical protein
MGEGEDRESGGVISCSGEVRGKEGRREEGGGKGAGGRHLP